MTNLGPNRRRFKGERKHHAAARDLLASPVACPMPVTRGFTPAPGLLFIAADASVSSSLGELSSGARVSSCQSCQWREAPMT